MSDEYLNRQNICTFVIRDFEPRPDEKHSDEWNHACLQLKKNFTRLAVLIEIYPAMFIGYRSEPTEFVAKLEFSLMTPGKAGEEGWIRRTVQIKTQFHYPSYVLRVDDRDINDEDLTPFIHFPQYGKNRGVIRQLLKYEYELGHSAKEAVENINRAKGIGTVAQSTAYEWVKFINWGSETVEYNRYMRTVKLAQCEISSFISLEQLYSKDNGFFDGRSELHFQLEVTLEEFNGKIVRDVLMVLEDKTATLEREIGTVNHKITE